MNASEKFLVSLYYWKSVLQDMHDHQADTLDEFAPSVYPMKVLRPFIDAKQGKFTINESAVFATLRILECEEQDDC